MGGIVKNVYSFKTTPNRWGNFLVSPVSPPLPPLNTKPMASGGPFYSYANFQDFVPKTNRARLQP